MQTIFIYLIAGVIFNALWDLMSDFLEKEVDVEGVRLTVGQRIVALVAWPIYLIFFAWHFLKGLNGNND